MFVEIWVLGHIFVQPAKEPPRKLEVILDGLDIRVVLKSAGLIFELKFIFTVFWLPCENVETH